MRTVFVSFSVKRLFIPVSWRDYPDYERVIPRDNDKKLIVDKNLLIASVKRVSLFSSAADTSGKIFNLPWKNGHQFGRS